MLDLEKYRQKLILENYDFLESKVTGYLNTVISNF